ncbi:amidoligase enzyme-domain-containing protein [Apiospora marii]|uniref:Amidoligase enzyme-domain-containing protein n=1 Tax=Apiospora marii TaxID=335849 RepID=A0ABR1S4J1_9PEZI
MEGDEGEAERRRIEAEEKAFREAEERAVREAEEEAARAAEGEAEGEDDQNDEPPVPEAPLPPLPPPKPLTYGVEIEGLVHYIHHDEVDPLASVEGLPKPVRLPKPFWSKPIQEWIWDSMTQTLAAHGIPTRAITITIKEPTSAEHDMAQNRLRQVGTWIVTGDNSITRPTNPMYSFVGVEINTSAEIDTPESFAALQYGIQCLTSEYRIIVNESCGLHVHVGNGASLIPLESIRRISALLWSADRVIGVLHAPWRRIAAWSQSIRQATELATGHGHPHMLHDHINDHSVNSDDQSDGQSSEETRVQHDTSMFCRYVSGSVRFGERSTLWRECHRSEAIMARYDESRAAGGLCALARRRSSQDLPPERRGAVGPEEAEGSYSEPNHAFDFAVPPANERLPGPSGTSSRAESPETTASSESSDSDVLDPEDMESQREIVNRVADLPETPFAIPSAPRRFTTGRPRCAVAKALTRDEVAGIAFKHFTHIDTCDESMNAAARPPSALLPGVQRLLAAESSCEVAELLSLPHRVGQPNYNFDGYKCHNLQAAERHTIEFREAESSLDPRWVATWARICIGLTKFAIHAPNHAFMRVIMNCELAEKGRGEYDVVDLLNQIGLFPEAAIAAERLWANREDWGLTFSEGDGGGGGDDSDDRPDSDNPGNGPSPGNGLSPGDAPGPDSGSGPNDDSSRPDDKPKPDGNPSTGNDAGTGNSEKPEEPEQENDSDRDNDKADNESNESNASLDSIDKIDGLHSIDGDSSSSSSDDDENGDGNAAPAKRPTSTVIRPQLPRSVPTWA